MPRQSYGISLQQRNRDKKPSPWSPLHQRQEAFPLEPVSIFIGNIKVTTDSMDCLKFWAHKHLAKEKFHSMGILHTQAFELVDWEIVYHTLWGVPKLFQLWACKQVMGIAGTKEWDKSTIHKCPCPCCLQARNTCKHVLQCSHHGRVETFHHTLDLVGDWLEEAETEPELLDILMEYA
jgi:hypothetical protein